MAPQVSKGRVVWVTGLSGAGKTTVSLRLVAELRAQGRPVVFLDGDELRAAVSDDLGFEDAQRRRSAMRNARLCRLLAEQGTDVVCATISMFHEVQRWNRAHIAHYVEIYLRVPLAELEKRDAKGIYANARGGNDDSVMGIHLRPEEPEAPDLVIDNHGEISVDTALERILARLHPGHDAVLPPAAAVVFGTKAETLERLAPRLVNAIVLPQWRFTVEEWRAARAKVQAGLAEQPWGAGTLIVRSSALSEDQSTRSAAGQFDSVANVVGPKAFAAAVEQVIASFADRAMPGDQVFVQPMLSQLALAGVAFTRDPNGGGPYIVINYDDASGRADLVTSGGAGVSKTFYALKSHAAAEAPAGLHGLVRLLAELEALLGNDGLDVEFAVDAQGVLHLLQVRAIAAMPPQTREGDGEVETAVDEIARKVSLLSRPHPYLHGDRSVFGVMPDWNPAEIVGVRPRPLALSLYRELVTDAIWAYQRDNYGYMNLRSFPLLVSLGGLPYVDVRVSFNSFVPKDVPADLAKRLVNYYIDRLTADPELHDKVEFEIIYSCYTLDLPQRLRTLSQHGFSDADIEQLAGSLRHLSNRIIHGQTGLWRRDRQKVELLAERLPILRDAHLDKISRVYWLIEDCKRYGTLPFAGLARTGFIAVQMLRSLVSTGVIDEAEYAAFMAGLDTVGSRIGHDFASLDRGEFLARYGHLRPGTYDISSPRYDDAPDLYFDWSQARPAPAPAPRFALSIHQLRTIERLIAQHGLEIGVLDLMEFIKAGIEGREYAKFVFSRTLSEALSVVQSLGADHGLSADDCAYLDFAAVRRLYNESGDVGAQLRASVDAGRRRHELSRKLVLPPLLLEPEDAFAFHVPICQPNFITQKSITAATAALDDPPASLKGRIVFVPSADPGFDWIFSRNICGFVTQFGGVNSHMAIRAGELGLPAVIGAGEVLFKQWSAARNIRIDCANRQVQIIS